MSFITSFFNVISISGFYFISSFFCKVGTWSWVSLKIIFFVIHFILFPRNHCFHLHCAQMNTTGCLRKCRSEIFHLRVHRIVLQDYKSTIPNYNEFFTDISTHSAVRSFPLLEWLLRNIFCGSITVSSLIYLLTYLLLYLLIYLLIYLFIYSFTYLFTSLFTYLFI